MTALAATDGRRLTLSPIGFRLVDELTGIAPIGRTGCELDAAEGAGWRASGIPAGRSLSGAVIFPNLGRTARRGLAGAAPLRFRARIAAEFYIPYYQSTSDGIVFSAPPWNDEEAPPDLPAMTMDVMLAPAPHMAFTTELRVLRGTVRGANGPVAFAEVSRGLVDRTLSDERGEYALPLRQPPFAGPVTIDAVERRTLLAGHIVVTLPDALGAAQPIVIS